MIEQLGNIGDFLGGVGVVVTLAYLAIQIRQNTAATRVQTVQHLLTSDTMGADALSTGTVPEVLAKVVTGERLTPTEVSTYTFYMRGRLTEAWQVHYQRQKGLIEDDVAEALLRRFDVMLGVGIFDAVWNGIIKTGFPPDFQEYVEQRMAEARGD